MARIKYDISQVPLSKKHYGFTFIQSAFGESMMQGQRNRTPRTLRQLSRIQNLQKCTRFWRTMSEASQLAWENFATNFPQASKRATGEALTGYQLFLKRNYYCFLNSGILTDFLEFPELVSLPAGTPVFSLQSGLNVVDITEPYLQNFGSIPSPGQWLLLTAVPYSEISGQFFPPIFQSVQVLETYIDGFFLSIEMTTIQPSIVYSVYLSNPVNAGRKYKSSKVRYMGCFTTKSFLGLSDTPGSYSGQAGKVVTVKPDETGLEFVAGGGGGLTCADLAACPKIISIDSLIANLTAILNATMFTTINYGYLYNSIAAGFSFIPGWHLATVAEYDAAIAFYGGINICGGKFKQTGLVYWNTPNTGADNASGFNAVGGGYRQPGSTGWFISKGMFSYYLAAGYQYTYTFSYNSLVTYKLAPAAGIGASLRLVKDDSVDPGYAVDFNGNVYKTVNINGKIWLASNLIAKNSSNGTPIPESTTQSDWSSKTLSFPLRCVYDNNESNR